MKNSQEGNTVRQNHVSKVTSKQEVNLKRNPTLHFQIGLILTLLACIIFIEMKMPVKAEVVPTYDQNLEYPEWAQDIVVETPKPKPQKQLTPPPAQQPDEILINDQPDTPEPDFIESTEPTDQPIAPVDPPEIDLGTFEEPEIIDFIAVEEAPLFPGCNAEADHKARKDCMSAKINKLVSRKFNAELGNALDLQGIHRVFIQFDVDQNGNVTNIRTRGPHPKLEAEAERVVRLFPQMQPGKQRGVPVTVRYQFPITLRME